MLSIRGFFKNWCRVFTHFCICQLFFPIWCVQFIPYNIKLFFIYIFEQTLVFQVDVIEFHSSSSSMWIPSTSIYHSRFIPSNQPYSFIIHSGIVNLYSPVIGSIVIGWIWDSESCFMYDVHFFQYIVHRYFLQSCVGIFTHEKKSVPPV